MYSPRYWGWKFFPVGVHKDLFKTKLPNKTGPQQILPLWHFAFPDHIWELIQVCVYLNTAGVRLAPFLEYWFDCQFKDIKLTQRNTTRRAWCPSQRMCNSARSEKWKCPPSEHISYSQHLVPPGGPLHQMRCEMSGSLHRSPFVLIWHFCVNPSRCCSAATALSLRVRLR